MDRTRVAEVATLRTMASTLAVFVVSGGIVGLLGSLGVEDVGFSKWWLFAQAFATLAIAAGIARWGERWNRGTFHALVSGGTIMVAVVSLTVALQLRGDVPLFTALAVDAVIVALGVITRRLVLLASGATRDPLTGLTNRRGFDDALTELMAIAGRSGQRLTAVLLDLDHFKAINDSQGHEAGDRVLRRVADVWTAALPAQAVFARHGGDEFAVLLPGTTGTEALALVRRIAPQHPEIGVSIGVAAHQPGDSAAHFMRRADHALYQAKAAGRGHAELDGRGSSELSRDLAAAVAAGEIGVHYQPVVDLSSGTLTGVEALARWTHPRLGPIPPDRFIAVAEQNGLIGALGEHVLRTAVAELTPIRRAVGGSLGLGINVSGRELCDPSYPQRVRAVLEKSGWPASDVVLEVTESMFEAHSSVAVTALHVLRASGLRIAIDDFGTGYSSLSRLDTLPVDLLKFDHSFIATIATSPRRAQMLKSMVGMAGALGLSLVAEGVETGDQDAVLRSVGCGYAQGWLYGRPMPIQEFGPAAERLRCGLLAHAVRVEG